MSDHVTTANIVVCSAQKKCVVAESNLLFNRTPIFIIIIIIIIYFVVQCTLMDSRRPRRLRFHTFQSDVLWYC